MLLISPGTSTDQMTQGIGTQVPGYSRIGEYVRNAQRGHGSQLMSKCSIRNSQTGGRRMPIACSICTLVERAVRPVHSKMGFGHLGRGVRSDSILATLGGCYRSGGAASSPGPHKSLGIRDLRLEKRCSEGWIFFFGIP